MIHTLPAGFVLHAPRQEDLAAVCELLNACDLIDCGQPDSPPSQVQEEWQDASFHLETDARVVFDPDKRIVAYAQIKGRHNHILNRFYGSVHPDYRGRGLGSYLLAFIEARAQDFVSLAPTDLRVTLETSPHSGNESARQLLVARGFLCNRHTWAMFIHLDEEPAQPNWPEGVTLRPFVPERDARAVFEANEEAFQDHWGHIAGNFELWYQRHFVANTQFDPSLWFIAMDGDEIAGLSLCDYYFDEGIVNVLGVRRPWRRKGLGLALLHHSFGEFYRRGTQEVTLGVDAESLTGATRLYERAGMSILLSYDNYEKELRSGTDLSTRVLER